MCTRFSTKKHDKQDRCSSRRFWEELQIDLGQEGRKCLVRRGNNNRSAAEKRGAASEKQPLTVDPKRINYLTPVKIKEERLGGNPAGRVSGRTKCLRF